MASLLGLFALFSLVIIAAGVLLTQCADRIADATSMGHSLAGLLLLAAATSLPELSVGWAAVRIDAVDLALGELFGSCLWNLLLLALIDLFTLSPGRLFSRASGTQALIATVAIVLAGISLLGLVLDDHPLFLGVSPFSWSILIGYFLCIRLVYHDHRCQIEVVPEVRSVNRKRLVAAVAGYLVAAAVIFAAAPRLARVSERLADVTGLGETFLGATFVAIVTSLPELVTTVAAVRLGRSEMAVANIFGSNAINLTILAAIDFASPDSILALASDVHLISVAAVIVVTSVALLGILYRAEKRFWLIEPDALLVIVLLIGALVLIYRHSH